jgi:deoxyribodipyrimidine photo-lyase
LLPALVGQDELVFATEVGTEEMLIQETVKKAVSGAGGSVAELWGSQTLFEPAGLPFAPNSVPEPFTAFRNLVENRKAPVPVPEPIDVPTLPSCPPLQHNFDVADVEAALSRLGIEPSSSAIEPLPVATRFSGGECAATERLESFVQHGLATYKQTRDCLAGEYFSSKLSPWLALGCISPRTVYHRIAKYEDEHGETVDTYWVGFELKWRDFFRFFAAKHGASLYQLRGPANRHVVWNRDQNKFQRWCQGQTGVPFVDANMRELASTGFMSNRGRQNMASYLTQDLQLDWRWGAIWFEHCLLDHDAASNYGNWACAAGVGMKGQRVNKFNIAKQSQQYDQDAAYIKTWVPEVANLPAPLAMAPWKAAAPVPNYPSPLTRPEYSAEALQFEQRRRKQEETVVTKAGYTMEKKRWHYGRNGAFKAS